MLLAEVQEVGNGLVCNVCDKAFESSRKLYFHNHYKHSVASSCNVCGKEFATKAKVQQHLRKVHSGWRAAPPAARRGRGALDLREIQMGQVEVRDEVEGR